MTAKIYKDDWDVTATGKMVFSIDYEALKEHKDWVDLFESATELRIEDSYICDCGLNYGECCKYPEKYRTTGCNEEE